MSEDTMFFLLNSESLAGHRGRKAFPLKSRTIMVHWRTLKAHS